MQRNSYSYRNIAVIGAALAQLAKSGLDFEHALRRARRRIHRFYSGTSKYLPHQGEREKLRRRAGGFHSVRQQGGRVELQRGRYVIVTPAAEEAARSFVTVTREGLAKVDA